MYQRCCSVGEKFKKKTLMLHELTRTCFSLCGTVNFFFFFLAASAKKMLKHCNRLEVGHTDLLEDPA